MPNGATTTDELRFIENWHVEGDALAEVIRRHASGGRRLEILEAGCGQAWPLDLEGVDYHLTGIDVDPAALAIRIDGGDLDVAVEGDLRTADLPDAQFDVIFNSFVLEHVEGARTVLDNFVRWLRPGGLILIRLPDRESVYGFAAAKTPHWVHVWFKRYIVGNPNAGKPGHEPYRTVYDEVVSRSGFEAYCRDAGLEVVDRWKYPLANLEEGIRTKMAVAGAKLIAGASFGRLSADHMWLTYILRKPGGDVAGSGS
jgi:SAM-dependent methyltransferase